MERLTRRAVTWIGSGTEPVAFSRAPPFGWTKPNPGLSAYQPLGGSKSGAGNLGFAKS